MKFMLEIATGNASFHRQDDDETNVREVDGRTIAQMLRGLASQIDEITLRGGDHGTLRDIENGYQVGTWKVTKR